MKIHKICDNMELSKDVNDGLNQLTTAIRSVASEVLGTRTVRKPWISADTLKLADEKRVAKSKRFESEAHRKTYNYMCKMTKKSAKKDKANSLSRQ